jgi:two-component system response regulator AtoC
VGAGLQLLIEPWRVAVQVQDATARREQVVEIRPTPSGMVNDHVGLPSGERPSNPSTRLPNRQVVPETKKMSTRPTGCGIFPEDQEPRIDALVRKAAPTTSLILITGESGTGKEVLARRIHADSAFASGPFLAINIGGIPENLLESELFGFEKGSFTGADKRKNGLFELASEGTLFLDEIGEMPMPLQVKLLRVLQERKIQRIGGTVQIPVESRILAATNRNLSEEVKAGRFREDLFYRLNVVPILVPPLRERAEDLPWLCSRLLEKLAKSMGKKVTGLTALAMNRLRGYSFPGNIRELENLLERALIFAEGEVITEEDLDLPKTSSTVVSTEEILSAPSLGSTLWELERRAITECLLKWEGNQTKAAEELGITRRTMFNKIKEYGLAISG